MASQSSLFIYNKSKKSRSLPEAVFLLYGALELQCRQCGIRMKKTAANTTKMNAHMDWHFRQNRRAKERGRHPIARDWFISKPDWMSEKEATVQEQIVPFQQETEEQAHILSQDQVEHPDLVLNGDEGDAPCAICNEMFVKIWNDEQEEWMLKNAIRLEEDHKVT